MKFRKLKANEIDARVNMISEKGCSLLLYKDARVDQNILDETVGPENWQRSHEVINGNLFCNVGIRIDRGDESEWVWKQDVGTESYTEKEKGQASDSFKRACFNWGIGRELYSAPFIWIQPSGVNISTKNGKQTTYDSFKVVDIGYNDLGEINHLKIKNNKTGKIVYTYGAAEPSPQPQPDELITEQEQMLLKEICRKKGLNVEGTFPNGIENLTGEQYAAAMRKLKYLKDKK